MFGMWWPQVSVSECPTHHGRSIEIVRGSGRLYQLKIFLTKGKYEQGSKTKKFEFQFALGISTALGKS